MCSIMGYCSRNAVLSSFMEGFQKTISRGPDDSRVVETGDGILGFHRLAIMGLTPSGMQPFRLGNSYVVCNGEIYGFEKLKKELSVKYTFESNSDCAANVSGIRHRYVCHAGCRICLHPLRRGSRGVYRSKRSHWNPPTVLWI